MTTPRPVDALFTGRVEAIRTHTCRRCHEAIDTFTDEVSEAEYRISGLCESCQVVVFTDASDAA